MVWAALRASQQRLKLTCVLTHKHAFHSQLGRGSLASQEENP